MKALLVFILLMTISMVTAQEWSTTTMDHSQPNEAENLRAVSSGSITYISYTRNGGYALKKSSTNGSWQYVASLLNSGCSLKSAEPMLRGDTLYVGYAERTGSSGDYRLTVKRLVNGGWQNVGPRMFSIGGVTDIKMAATDNNIYIGYLDQLTGELVIKRFVNDNWETVFSTTNNNYLTYSLNYIDDCLYLVYDNPIVAPNGYGGGTLVPAYNTKIKKIMFGAVEDVGQIWSDVFVYSIAISARNGSLLVYRQDFNTVKCFKESPDGWVPFGTSPAQSADATGTCFKSYEGSIYVAYSLNRSLRVYKQRADGSWLLLGSFSGQAPFLAMGGNNIAVLYRGWVLLTVSQREIVRPPQDIELITAYGSNKITWQQVEAADAYRIYASDTANGTFIPIADRTNNCFVETIGPSKRFYKVTSVLKE